jgi:hypothetical protein
MSAGEIDDEKPGWHRQGQRLAVLQNSQSFASFLVRFFTARAQDYAQHGA